MIALTSLLKGMLCKDVKNRMTLEEVEAHSWTQQECSIDDYIFHEVIRCCEYCALCLVFIVEFRICMHVKTFAVGKVLVYVFIESL